MSILDRITSMFQGGKRPIERGYWIAVRCARCGEVVRARVDLYNDLSATYGEGEVGYAFITRKVLVGEGRCYQPLEVELHFDENRKFLDRQVRGGTFVDEQAVPGE